MRARSATPFAALVLALFCSACAEVEGSWNTAARTAVRVHRGEGQALCESFTREMLAALPCDSVQAVMQRTTRLLGEPTGACHWIYTYRIYSLTPLRASAIYECPFEREPVRVTVATEETEDGARVSGLWIDSPTLRNTRLVVRFALCRDIDERERACRGELSQATWESERIAVWNHLQNLRADDRVVWKWYTPSGRRVEERVHLLTYQPAFDHRDWSTIEPARLAVERPYGTWTVKLEVNGEEIGSFDFDVVRATS